MKKLHSKKIGPSKQLPIVILGLVLCLAVVIIFVRSRKITKTVDINVVQTQQYGHIILRGTIFKETPPGVQGVYFMINETGNSVELQAPGNLDKLIGQPVQIEGELIPPKVAGGRQILVVSSIELNQGK
jgi:hypothetical protein